LGTGIRLMDDGHRRQAELVDALVAAVTRGEDEAAQELLLRLVEETSDHFAAEQELMRASGFPDFGAHVEEHDALLRQVSALLTSHSIGEDRSTLELAGSLKAWLEAHIRGKDRILAAYLGCPVSSS
jgi:hemerythrin